MEDQVDEYTEENITDTVGKVISAHGSIYCIAHASVCSDGNLWDDNKVVLLTLFREGRDNLCEFTTRRMSIHDLEVWDYEPDTWCDIPTSDIRQTSLAKVVKSYGEHIYSRIQDISKQVVSARFESSMSNFINQDLSRTFPMRWENVNIRTQLFQPEVVDADTVSVIRNGSDALRGRRTNMKIGKAFRLMFPEFTDVLIASAVERYRHVMTPRSFILKVGTDRASFAKAFGGERCSYQSPSTTYLRKSIASSCMQLESREDEDGDYVYFGEAYASGDFAVAWLETEEGLIGGRVVYSTINLSHAPLYGACESGLDMLQCHLDSLKVDTPDGPLTASEAHDCEWDRHNMLRIEGREGGPIAPYLDVEICADDHGDNIKLCVCGSYELNSTEGYLYHRTCCENCGDAICEDSIHYSNDGYPYCESCFDEIFARTDDGDIIDRDEAVYANYLNGYNKRVYEGCFHIDDTVYIDALDEHWKTDDCSYVDELDDYYPDHLISGLEFNDNEEEEDNNDRQSNAA